MKNFKTKVLKSNKLVKQLILYFLFISLVPLTVVTSLVYWISSTTGKTNIINNLSVIAESKANKIETFITEKQKNAASISQLPTIIQAIDRYRISFEKYGINSQEYQAVNFQNKLVFNNYLENMGYQNIFLVSQKGDVIFSVKDSQALGKNLYTNSNYKQSQLAKIFDLSKTLMQVEISNYDYYQVTDESVVFIASPIFKEKLILGVVIFQINNEDLYQVVNDYTGLGQTGETLMGIERNKQIIFVTPTRHDRKAAFQRKIDINDYIKHPLVLAAKGLAGKGNFSDYRGEETLAVWRYLPSLNSGIVVKIDSIEAMASLITNRNIILSLGIITLLLVTIAAILVAQSISAPVVELTQAAKNIACGQLDKTIKCERTDELGELATSFNKMARQLKESFDSLEQRVAELKLAKNAAVAASESKDRFLANISHELRTPLNSIIGYSKILQRDSTTSSPLQRSFEPRQILNLRIIQQSGNYLLSLIDEILDFSKSKVGKIELLNGTVDLQNFLIGVVGIMEMQVREKNIRFIYETVGTLPSAIKADEKRLRQVLLNLLSNAVKFTDLGEVTLKVSLFGDLGRQGDREMRKLSDYSSPQPPHPPVFIRFEVIDTGVGMNKEVLEKIFQPFEQAGDETSRAKGTGLGLSITKQLIELMGSKIDVKSQLGRGSTFWFDLCCEVVELPEEENKNQEYSSQILGYKGDVRQVLIVDDRFENRLLLASILKPLGFEVNEANDGEQGLEIASKTRPDLILTDLMMPHKTGLRMVMELRKRAEFKETPIIGISASIFIRNQSISAGCNEFLPKPIDEETLLALLQNYLHLEWVYNYQENVNV